MEELKNKLSQFWEKCKTFLTKEYYGLPLWSYLLVTVVLIPIALYFFKNRSTNSKTW